jgi:hypothetical protein
MTYRPFRSRCVTALAACAFSLGTASLIAQTSSMPNAPMATGSQNPSRVDVFLGYSYFGAHGSVKSSSPSFSLPYSSINEGAIGSGAYYFNRYFGVEALYANHPGGTNDGDSSAAGGLIVRFPMDHLTLFAHGLAGADRLNGPSNAAPAQQEWEPNRWGPSLRAGGGMDYDLPWFDNRFSLRLFQADYRWIHEDYGPPATIPTGGILGGRTNMDAVELSTGLVAHFGHVVPPPPVTYACSVSPASGYPGDPITVTGTASNLNPKKTATYSWTSTGGTISGTSSTGNITTANAAPGTYTVTGHVTEGEKPGQSADCTGQFTINDFQPPTISCSANPTSVNPGDSATITSMASSPQNRPLTYSYSATGGSVSGTGSSATLSTQGAAPGPDTVTCNVVDDKGHSASATTSVNIIAPPPPPPPPAPQAQAQCTVNFTNDKARPTRVDNEAKACLDDIAVAAGRDTSSKIALVGNEDAKEKKVDDRMAKMRHHKPSAAELRAVNTKDYLVSEKGIDASRIMVYTGTDDAQTVTTTLVPAGATNPVASDTTVDESAVKAVPRTPAAKKAMKKAAK